MSVNLKRYDDPATRSRSIVASFNDTDIAALGDVVYRRVIERIADAIAEEYVATHKQELMAAIDPNAVANLAVADAAAAIRRTVDDGLKGLSREVGRPRTVVMEGWFGQKRGVIR